MSIPADWNFGKLGEVCSIAYGKGLPVKSFKSDGFPVFGANGIIGFSDTYHHENEQVLISCRGAASGTINMSPKKCFVTNNSLVLKINNKNLLLKKFLFFALHVAEKSKLVSGTAQPQVTINNANELLIPIPPLPEQHLIVSKIEELFSELDNGIAQLKTAQQQLKVYRQSLLKAAFEGRLTAVWRTENRKVNKEKLSMAAEPVMGYGEKGNLPEGWKWVTIDSLLIDKKKGMMTGPFGTMLKKSEHQENGVRVIGIENIGVGIFKMPNKIFISNEKAQTLRNFKLIENDIIISRSGTVGEICLVPKFIEGSVISTNLIRVRLDQLSIYPEFFVYLFLGGLVRQQVFDLSKGSSRAFLNQGILKKLVFPICSILEQIQVVQVLDNKLTVCDKIEETINQNLQQAEAMRQSILKRAFEGRFII